MTTPRISKRHMRFILAAVATSALITIGSIASASYISFANRSPSPSTAVATLVSNNSKQVSSEELRRSCLPSGVSESYFIGEFSGEFETYLLWRLTVDNETFLRVNTLFGEACGLAFDGRSDRVFGDRVSASISQQLWLLFYQDRVNALGGVAALQANINERFANQEDSHFGGPVLFDAGAVWALEQLGITLPTGEWELIEPM